MKGRRKENKEDLGKMKEDMQSKNLIIMFVTIERLKLEYKKGINCNSGNKYKRMLIEGPF